MAVTDTVSDTEPKAANPRRACKEAAAKPDKVLLAEDNPVGALLARTLLRREVFSAKWLLNQALRLALLVHRVIF